MKAQIELILCAGLLATTACQGGTDGTNPSETTIRTSPIVDGTPAGSRIFDAVGALVTIDANGDTSPFCTAWLTSPRVVATAKHCLLLTPPDQQIGFAVGPDAFNPDRVYLVQGRIWERSVDAPSIMSLGSDTAVVTLAQPVRGIIPVIPWPLSRWDIDHSFEVIGYGNQSLTDPAAAFGERLRGRMRLEGLGSDRFWPIVYNNDLNSYLADAQTNQNPVLEAFALASWDEDRLLDDYEALLEKSHSLATSGDSGGPLIRRFGPFAISYGVTSGIAFQSGDNDLTVQSNFAVYATLGPEAVHMIHSAAVCGEVPEEGVCQGNVRRRCTGLDEGRIRLTTEDCGARGAACSTTPSGAQCTAACTTDSDCLSYGAGGVCDDGQCAWSEPDICRGEPGALGCYLCCLGQATGGDFEPGDFAICGQACFGIPIGAAASSRTVEFGGFQRFPALGLP